MNSEKTFTIPLNDLTLHPNYGITMPRSSAVCHQSKERPTLFSTPPSTGISADARGASAQTDYYHDLHSLCLSGQHLPFMHG